MYSAADSADKPLPHCTPSSSSGSLPSLVHFVLSVLCYTDELVICLGAPSLQALLHMQQRYEALLQSHFTQDQLRKVHLLPVYPWGHFTTALNVATLFVADLQADAIMFQVNY